MIYKTEQHNHQTYVLFQDAIRLLKGNRNYKKKRKKNLIDQSQIYTCSD